LNTIFKGKSGEEFVCSTILSWGYKIVERNFLVNFGEIDIIAYDNDILCFIEVRSKSNSLYGHPSETINSKKQNSIKKVAEYFLIKHHLSNIPIRFDVATILWNSLELLYFKNAF
jgi:putative endonuclease